MSTETLEAPTLTADPFDVGLDKFFNPEVKPAEVKDSVVTETVEPKVELKEEVKTEVKKEEAPVTDLMSGISDDAEPAVEVQEEETKEYPPEIRSIKAREHFDALKASKRAAEKKAADMEMRVKELESKGGLKAPEVAVLQKQYDELKAKYDEQYKVVAAKAIEETDDFKNTVTIPMKEAIDELVALRDLNNLSSIDLDKALEEPDRRKRNIMLSELADNIEGRLNQEDFFNAAKKFVEARQKEAQLYEDADGSMEFAQTKKQEEEAANKLKSAEEYKNARQTVIENLSSKLTELKEDPAVWEKVVADAEAVDWDALPPKMKAFAAVAMQSIQPYKALSAKQAAEIKRLNGIIASRNAASPGASSGSVTQTQERKGDFLEGIPT